MLKLKSTFIFALLLPFFVSAQNIDPIVKTDKGYIKGLTENGINVFKGVPYAAPPVGNLRFKPTLEHAAWTDTLSTQKFGSVATQSSGKGVTGTEDCLSLNVYTPKADNHKRAVMVWVHGGSMTNGAGKGEDGHAFADNDDIITVTINYRLGVFGFLYMGDVDKAYTASGSSGVLDCIMALKWIKQNIAAFGGDPDRVTIMGESAGAKLISAVLVSPLSKGLFQQYIAESGSVQCIRSIATAKNERSKILTQLGLKQSDVAKLLTLPADSIIKAQNIVCAGIGGNSFFGPVEDGVVITNDGYHYAESKSMPRIKALIGTNQYEAALFVSEASWKTQPDINILKPLFADNYTIVYKTYLKELQTLAPYDAAIKTLTQYMYQMHSYRFAAALAKNNIPVWMYRFDYSDGKKFGAAHAAELKYVWNEHHISSTAPDTVKRQLAANIHNVWVAFIKTGNPNISISQKWPNYNTSNKQVMVFDTISKVFGLKEVFNDTDFPSSVFVLKGE